MSLTGDGQMTQLMYDETGKYNTPEKISLMQNLGSEIVGFNKAPYTILLQ